MSLKIFVPVTWTDVLYKLPYAVAHIGRHKLDKFCEHIA